MSGGGILAGKIPEAARVAPLRLDPGRFEFRGLVRLSIGRTSQRSFHSSEGRVRFLDLLQEAGPRSKHHENFPFSCYRGSKQFPPFVNQNGHRRSRRPVKDTNPSLSIQQHICGQPKYLVLLSRTSRDYNKRQPE